MGMRVADNRIGSVMDLYDRELADLYPQEEVRAIVRHVFHHKLGMDTTRLVMERQAALSESELLEVYLPLKRLRQGEPLQYVIGEVLFQGLTIGVDPSVLIPRPETEELVERIVAASPRPPRHVLDVGTGSGCIALALKKHFPDAEVIGMDVSAPALERAKTNARINGLELGWLKADVLKDRIELPAGLDLVVSNPPYIPRSERAGLDAVVRDHEPELALFVDDADPLVFYRAITTLAAESLAPGGQLWFETEHRFGEGVRQLVRDAGFQQVALGFDLSGNARFVHGTR